MALTYEEKIEKLRQHENWWQFSDPQRVFLDGMAQGLSPIKAAEIAYPQSKNRVNLVKSLLARVGIQSALDSIGLDFSRPNITKNEAIKHLSRFMRLAKDATEYCKLLTQYAKLQGWDVEEGTEKPDEVTDLNKLVTAMEKKRKQTT